MLHLFLGMFIAWLLYYSLHDWYKRLVQNFPPGPHTLPLIGGLYSLNPQCPHLSVEKLVKHYGKVLSIRMGPMGQMVFIQDINLINQIFESTEYNDRPEMAVFDVLNQGANGIGSCKYDERWKKLYKVLHNGLAKVTKNEVEKTALQAFEQLINKFLQKGTKYGNESYNPRGDILKAYSVIFSSFIYGIQPEDLDSSELETRMKYHDTLMTMLNPMHPMNILPFLWKLTTPEKKKIMKCLKERDRLFNESYEKHVEDFNGSLKDIMDIITEFELSKEHSEEINDVLKEIGRKDMFLSAWTMYLAGCDTTSTVTQWLMFYMCVHPQVQENIQHEVDGIIGHDDMQGILEQKDQLHYTRACLYEVLRCASTIGVGLPRVSNRDQQLDRYKIPKGTIIMLNQWSIHHNEDLWPDPFTFKPERFLNEAGKLYSNYHIFKKMPFIPFSRGKRSCIGQHLALDLILVFVVELTRRVNIKHPTNFVQDSSAKINMILQPQPFPIECTRKQRYDRCHLQE